MCLELFIRGNAKYRKTDPHSSFMKRLNASKKGEIVCWKIYKKNKNNLSSVIMECKVENSGVVQSNRKNTKLEDVEIEYGEVDKGIHVYSSREKAKRYTSEAQEHTSRVKYIVVSVICRKSNFVAQGIENEAVFTKVRIEKRTWDKIFRAKK